MTAIKGIFAFGDAEYVMKHTRDLTLLRKLHARRLTQEEATHIVYCLCDEFDLEMPGMRFTGRTDRGHYWSWKYLKNEMIEKTIVIRPEYISTHVLIHELAHHWVRTKMKGQKDGDHGFDFTLRLDKLAVATPDLLAEIGLEVMS